MYAPTAAQPERMDRIANRLASASTVDIVITLLVNANAWPDSLAISASIAAPATLSA